MTAVSKQSSDNIGSVVKIEVVKAKDVASFPSPGELTALSASIVLKNGYDWENLYFTPETAQASDNDTLSEGGNLSRGSITGKTPYINSDSDASLKDYLNHGLIVRVTDGNGKVRVFGRPDQPYFLQYQRTSPAQTAGYNGYEFSITGEQIYSPVFLS